MKLTINSAALKAAADLAAKTVGVRPAVPIYACAHLSTDDGHLRVTATDGNSWLRTAFPATVHISAKVAVSARLLAAVASAMPAGDVDLVCEDGRLTVTGARRATSTLPTLPAEDYPTFPQVDEDRLVRLPGKRFADALDLAGKVAGARPENPANIRRVTLRITREQVRILTTDRYVLVDLYVPGVEAPWLGHDEVEVALEPTCVGPAVAIARTVDVATLALPGDGPGQFCLGAGTARAVVPQVAGPSGDYDILLRGAAAYEQSTVVGALALVELCSAVAPFAGDNAKGHLVSRLSLSAGELEMRAGTAEEGAYSASIEVGWEHEDWTAAVNPRYLSESVRALGADEVRLNVGHPKKPFYLTVDGRPDRALVMPIAIPSKPAPGA